MDNWHTGSVDEALRSLGTDKDIGLSVQKAKELLEENGKNRIKGIKKQSLLQRFFAQLKNFLVILLIFAALISLVVEVVETKGHPNVAQPLLILLIVVINAAIGVYQESKAEAALERLKKYSAPKSRVVRDGQIKRIDSAELVPGDIILLEAGDRVPADGRIIESFLLKCDESILTGNFAPVEKDALSELDVTAVLTERNNMVYMGSGVISGRARIVATATGMNTETGRIAGMLSNEENSITPLQKKLSDLGKKLGIAVLIVCTVLFFYGSITLDKNRPEGWIDVFLTAVSLAVAAIPEGLPAIATIVLSIGTGRMLKLHAIVKRYSTVETLGSVSVICTDKTGTLTSNQMSVSSIWSLHDEKPCNIVDDKPSDGSVRLLQLAALCCNSRSEEYVFTLLPTETAILKALNTLGQDKCELEESYVRVRELPFDSERKLMTTIHRTGDRFIAITKGAPDILLTRCHKADAERISRITDEMSKKGLRVLAVACKELDELPDSELCEEAETSMTFIGLIGISDPPRDEARAAIRRCDEAGIRTIMLTGDHIVTAEAVAKDLGILSEGDAALTGQQLAEMNDDELFNSIRRYSVFSRVTPNDRVRIINAWQKAGEVVATVGNSVDDSPALMNADIGCALGSSCTDVAKNAAQLTVTDESYTTLVDSIREGRGIWDNIRKSIHFLLSCNLGEIIAVFFGMLIFKISPLTAMQLLLINLLTDSLPALALGFEPYETDIMNKRPQSRDRIMDRPMVIMTVLFGVVIGIISIIAYAIGNTSEIPGAGQTMAFGVLALSQLVHVLNARTSHSIFDGGFFQNKFMLIAEICSLCTTLIIMLVPGLNEKCFELVTIPGSMWLTVILLSLVPLVVSELAKLITELLRKNNIIE